MSPFVSGHKCRVKGAMSGGNSANSSWTIVSPEETVAETVRPLEEQTKHHVQVCEPRNQPPEGADCTSSLSVDNHQDAEEIKADPCGDSITDRPPSLPSSAIDAPVPAGEVQSEVAPDNPNQDAFSDSLSHVTPSPDEPSGSPMSAETLGGVDLTQQEERHDGTREEDLKQEGLESDLLSQHPGFIYFFVGPQVYKYDYANKRVAGVERANSWLDC